MELTKVCICRILMLCGVGHCFRSSSMAKSILCRVMNAISFVILVLFFFSVELAIPNAPYGIQVGTYIVLFFFSTIQNQYMLLVTVCHDIKILSKYSKRHSAIRIVTKLLRYFRKKNFSFQRIFGCFVVEQSSR